MYKTHCLLCSFTTPAIYPLVSNCVIHCGACQSYQIVLTPHCRTLSCIPWLCHGNHVIHRMLSYASCDTYYYILKVRKQSTLAEIFRTFWTCSTNRDDWVRTYSKSTSAVPSFNLRTDEQTDEIPFRPWCQMTRRDDIEKSRSSVRPMSSYRRTIANPVAGI